MPDTDTQGVALDPKGLEAACKATILGEDEDGGAVHLEYDEAETAVRAYLSAVGGEAGALHGPFGWFIGCRALSEDNWTLESDPLHPLMLGYATSLRALQQEDRR